jgi:hypothetical protein
VAHTAHQHGGKVEIVHGWLAPGIGLDCIGLQLVTFSNRY